MRRICFALAGLATLLASPAALAADADVLRQFGMQGRQAIDCSRPHSQDNPHVIYAVSPQGRITRTLRMTPELDGTFPMRNLRMLGPETMQFDETGRQSELTITVAKINGKYRSVKMLFQHNPSEPIGIWDTIKEDTRGLYVRGRLMPEVARAREVLALMRAGALDGLSIGFRALKGRRDARTGVRRLEKVDLWEISVVTFPLLPGARVAHVKSHDRHRLAASIAAATNLLRQASQTSLSPRGRGREAMTYDRVSSARS